MIWTRKPALLVVGLLLGFFGLGVLVGSRFMQRPPVYRDVSVVRTSPPASAAPIPGGEPSCVDIRGASKLKGKRGCVAGRVLRVYTAASGNTFLDFCQDFRTCPFTSVIFAADKANFGDVASLQGKPVEIRGDIVEYRGRAEIILHESSQVRSAE